MEDLISRVASFFARDKPPVWGLAIATPALLYFWFRSAWGQQLFDNPAALAPVWLGFWAVGTTMVWTAQGIVRQIRRWLAEELRRHRKNCERQRMAKSIRNLDFETLRYLRAKLMNTAANKFRADMDRPHLTANLEQAGVIANSNWDGHFVTQLARQAIWANPEIVYLKPVQHFHDGGRVLRADDERWGERVNQGAK